jgi:hypothetical protein
MMIRSQQIRPSTHAGIEKCQRTAGQAIGTGTNGRRSIAAGTYIVRQLSGQTGGTGTYEVSVAQTVPSQALTASRASFIYNTLISGSQFLWGKKWQIAAEPQLGIIQIGHAIGLDIEHPITTFAWTPDADCLFEIGSVAGSQVGVNTPQQGFRIGGDVRRFRAKPCKKVVDDQASPSSWKTPRIAPWMV